MSTLQIVLVLVAVVLVLAWLWLRQGRSHDAPRTQSDRIDTITGWPPQATRVLSTQERVAFGTLVRALPEYMVLAQVPLARFINVPKRNSYADWLRRVGYQSVDFVVCDMAAQVVAVVELQAVQVTERARKRITRIARTLKAANIPLHIWTEASLPSAEAAREALLPQSEAALPIAPAAPPRPLRPEPAKAAAAPALSPFDELSLELPPDESVELLEPPPSTWFDDLDSDPAPLGKR
jgi:Protein of unknown function (DUF2726)